MGCLKLSYYPTNFEVEKNYFKNCLTSNFSKNNVRSSYELSNPVNGNVHVVISDRKLAVDDNTDGVIDYFIPDVLATYDYYAGVGMLMPGRVYEGVDFRYGAQGSEVVKEINGTRNHITTYFREGDLQTQQWWSLDPKPSAGISPYAMFNNNPVLYNDVLGDTVRTKGFSENKILKDLGKGLGVKKDANPYSFDKKGDLQTDQSKYDALSNGQKEIANNINEAIGSDITFTITKGKNSQVLGKDSRGNDITLWDAGGAATVGYANKPKIVDIFMTGATLSGDDRARSTSGSFLRTPNWLTLYHELGGHGNLRYIKKDPLQAGKTIDYENKLRSIHGLGVADYTKEHPNPNPIPQFPFHLLR